MAKKCLITGIMGIVGSHLTAGVYKHQSTGGRKLEFESGGYFSEEVV